MLVKGKYMITHPGQEDSTVEDGAICIQGQEIAAVGPYRQLADQFPQEETVGSDDHVIMPGLINAHDHGRGPSAFQLGTTDDYVELWLMALLGQRAVDPYLATAFSAIRQIESGVTTVVHSYYDPALAQNEQALEKTIAAYEQSGLRVTVALGILDQSPITALSEALLPSLPADLHAQVAAFLGDRPHLEFEDFVAIYRRWRRRLAQDHSRVALWPSPVAVHWCSEELLLRLRDEAQDGQTMMQAHALETVFQRDQALAHRGQTVIAWLDEIDFLGPRLSLAHCLWSTDDDLDRLADKGVSVVHNPGSNLRLGSGTAPVRKMMARGINVALGTDSHGLNDDADMLQEMRLAAVLQRGPGADCWGNGMQQVLRMATQNGARALGIEDKTGVLEVGKQADLVLLRLDELQYPFVDTQQNVDDTVVSRGRARHVDTVIASGQVLMREREHLALDKAAVVSELQQQLASALDPHREAWRQMMQQLKPYIDRHYNEMTFDANSKR